MDYVPTVNAIDEIYESSEVPSQLERYKSLVKKFRELYKRDPEFIARSPGRVNLIGEHIDYVGFGVLPMAIDRDVVIVVATTDSDARVRLANSNPTKYPSLEFNHEGSKKVVTIDSSKRDWGNYFKCGYRGVLAHPPVENPRGMFCLVDGTVPPGGGLSSSAAFVCSAALATLTANRREMTKRWLAETATRAERDVGVNSGGMDQSASVFGLQFYALNVEFVPTLKVTPVPFPKTEEPFTFVIANTGVIANKVDTAPTNYNLRVAETRMAAACLSKFLKLDGTLETLKNVMDSYFSGKDLVGLEGLRLVQRQIAEMLENVERFFTNKNGYTQREIADILGVAESELRNTYAIDQVRTDLFRLHQRSTHVYSEALRVVFFRAALEEADGTLGPISTDKRPLLTKLGSLLNESHASCRNLYDCSCPELDDLCNIAIASGAVGARLTGAGWGGCTVSLVPKSKLESFFTGMKAGYYEKRGINKEEWGDMLFATKPGNGSAVLWGMAGLNE